MNMLRQSLAAVCLAGFLGAQTSVPFTGPGLPVSIGNDLQGLLIYCSTDFNGNDWFGYVTTNGTHIESVPISETQGLVNGVATDGGTVVFIVDSPFGAGNGEIDVYDLDGNHQVSFSTPSAVPTGVAYNYRTGTIFVTDSTNVYEFDSFQGTVGTLLNTTPLAGAVGVTGIAWDAVSNTYWIRDDALGEVRVYDSAFTLLSIESFVWSSGETRGLAHLEGRQSLYMMEVFGGSRVVVVGLASADPFGEGCGALPLAFGADRPVFGSTMTMTLSNTPLTPSMAVVLFGVTSPNLALDVIGATGCVLRSNAEIATVPVSGAQLDVMIPSMSSDLIGVFLFAQGVVVDGGGELTTSNGLRLTVGSI